MALASAAGDDDLAPGAFAGEYRIEKKLGEGGMGAVYGARHPLIGKRAAIKVLRGELSASQAAVDRFVLEAQAVNQIGHPNIVDVFAFGRLPDGRSYFAMEWLAGESLRERLARPLELTDAIDVIDTVARALQAAHDAGVVHRDLKPDNVFLVSVRDEKPTVKLLDFGIAKLQSGGGEPARLEKTRTGVVLGTPLYLSPEQAKGGKIDAATDIYSLGVMAYELVTGRVPLTADSAVEIMSRHITDTPERPRTHAPGLPEVFDALLMAMLEKEPAQRPSLAQIRATLAQLREAEGGVPKRSSSPAIGQRSTPDALGLAETATPSGQAAVVAPTSSSPSSPPAITPSSSPVASPVATPAASTPPSTSPSGAAAGRSSSSTSQPAEPARSRRGLWLGLGVLVAGGAVAAVLLSSRGGDAPERTQVAEATSTVPAASGSETPVPSAGSATGAAGSASDTVGSAATSEPVGHAAGSAVVSTPTTASAGSGTGTGTGSGSGARDATAGKGKGGAGKGGKDGKRTPVGGGATTAPPPVEPPPPPPPSVEEAPKPARITLSSPGAVISVDGKLLGSGRVVATLTPGPHRVIAQLANGQGTQLTLQVAPGEVREVEIPIED